MNEEAIAQQLKQSVTEPPDTVAQVAPPAEGTPNQANVGALHDVDELIQYKLHDLFGEQYKPNDEVKRQQVSYIYEAVSSKLEDKSYGFVAAKIREIQRIAGIASADDQIYRLYQWLKLDTKQREVDAEMRSLSDG